MSARKLGRVAGLVFVLAAIFVGSPGVTNVAAIQSGAVSTTVSHSPAETLEIIWT